MIAESKSGTVLVILAGRPDDKGYEASATRVGEMILDVGERAQFTAEERSHRRADDSAAINIGSYYGGGAKKPGNMDNGRHTEIAQELIKDPDLSRVAAFADGAYCCSAPEVGRLTHAFCSSSVQDVASEGVQRRRCDAEEVI